MISRGHGNVWDYSFPQFLAHVRLAQENRKQEMSELLALHTLAASGDGKLANKQINKWMSEEEDFQPLPEDRPTSPPNGNGHGG